MMPSLTGLKYSFLAILFLLCGQVICYAQLKADFFPDKAGGCSPVAVAFTNTTVGASSAAVYEWNFGNGNMSSLKDASAIFVEEKIYAVTLTVKDSGKTSIQTQTFTVYKKPTIEFAVSVQKGCAPLAVAFTSSSSAGDGTLAASFWDFGDGTTGTSFGNTINHNYTASGKQSASLTVTNSYGCQSALLKENLVEVLPSLIASFQPRDSFLCTINDSAFFINNTAGPGTLSYNWDFGDGATSVSDQPSHVYKAVGAYLVQLKVTSSEGCNSSSTYNTLINVGNFKSLIDATAPFCRNEGIWFRNASSPIPVQSEWTIDNSYSYTKSGSDSVQAGFNTKGSHTIKLVNSFGACRQTIDSVFEINEIPDLKGYIAEIQTPCGAPAKVNFKDTTAGAVKWLWGFNGYTGEQPGSRDTTYEYLYNNYYDTYLTVVNAAGCKAFAGQRVIIQKPIVVIKSPDVTGGGSIVACGHNEIKFYTESQDSIVIYKWDFGDGSNSSDSKPVHTFLPGDYRVKLNYTLANGCTGETEFDGYVAIRKHFKDDFTISGTDICGNNPVYFTNITSQSNYLYYNWDFGDGETGLSFYQYQSTMHKYEKEGTFTVTLIVTDMICSDTIIKTNVIKISPPFPKITGYSNTCERTRGEVTFTQTSKQTDSWLWDFGDGQTQLLTTDQPEIKHTYTKTGSYKVVLTNHRGSCTVGDSIYNVLVLVKKKPILTANKTTLCNWDEFLELSISNLDKYPGQDYYGYSYYDWYYNDGTNFQPKTYGDVYSNSDLNTMPYIQSIRNLALGKDSFALVVHTGNFLCIDSTNYIPIKIKGPDAFIQTNSKPCSKGNVVFLQDSSTVTNGVPIKLWEWNFAYFRSDTSMTNGNEFAVNYTYPGTYPVQLKVTDAEGCVSYAYKQVDAAMNALEAGFSNSATTISPGTSIDFTNTTTTSDNVNTQYNWSLGDGTVVNTFNAAHTYTQPGTYTIRLIAKNPINGCADTATTIIVVKFVNAAFSINSSFVSNSKCPPVLVTLNNTSSNVSKINWDFGDGTVVDDIFEPSHIYTAPGKYIITLKTWSDNGTLYTTKDSVEIIATAASLKADNYYSCNAKQITLSAAVKNIPAYVWDFGDGTIVNATDSFAAHFYNNAGIYNPRLMLTDANGCNSSVNLDKPIVIDYLSVALPGFPQSICSPKEVVFTPAVISTAGNQSPQSLSYHWNFGTGKPADTSNISNPSFLYSTMGIYPVTLKVQSPYGCVKEVSTTINALQGLGGQINGPTAICEGTTAQFTGSTQLPGQPQWKWIFDDGTVVQQQNPPTRLYNNSGVFQVKLIVDNGGCADTVLRSLQVNQKPTVGLSVKQATICEGSAITITASGGSLYAWSPATGLNNPNFSTINASPVTNTNYTITVTNVAGCVNTDALSITVVHPFNMQLSSDVAICNGKSTKLNVTGANTYQWIQNTAGLNNTNIAGPLAAPSVTTIYTVVGKDSNNCFADTASVKVTVLASPVADAGQSVLMFAGSTYQLQPTYSNDVSDWNWTPAQYLNCTNCAAPVVKPGESVLYTVTVSNAQGCTASDTVSVNLLCSESRIYIPGAFSPNNDGLNDLFIIKGQGIRMVNHLVIFNRFGTVIFERNNFQPGDINAAWDGSYKGKQVPAGSYVYFAEMSCNEKTFTQKGSVMVVH